MPVSTIETASAINVLREIDPKYTKVNSLMAKYQNKCAKKYTAATCKKVCHPIWCGEGTGSLPAKPPLGSKIAKIKGRQNAENADALV